jgi:23S rRNA-/tRNA-specific pseudouridylate synthase
VHLASIGHPVAGDRTYGSRLYTTAAQRLFLHAWRIGFVSPASGERVTVEAPLAPELATWLAGL